MTGMENNVYTFEVAKSANKVEIAQAIEAIFDVTVVKVNTMNVKPKPKRVRYQLGTTRTWKKAMVTVAEGDHDRDLCSGIRYAFERLLFGAAFFVPRRVQARLGFCCFAVVGQGVPLRNPKKEQLMLQDIAPYTFCNDFSWAEPEATDRILVYRGASVLVSLGSDNCCESEGAS